MSVTTISFREPSVCPMARHTETDFVWVAGVHEIGHALTSARNGRVYFAALCVAPSALDVALDEMMIHCVENNLWDLCPGRIVKENKSGSPIQSRKSSTNICDREAQRG
jgi:hypothetical protein